jgi:hypothetical protein
MTSPGTPDFSKTIFFIERTIEHIHRVHKNMVLLVTKYPAFLFLSGEDIRQLMGQILRHDKSKFSDIQYLPYVELTEFYRQRKNLNNKEYQYPSAEIEEQVNNAIEHHYFKENHHIENQNFVWGKFEALECACDLQAMAQEFNEGTARKYFEEKWMPKAKLLFGPFSEKFAEISFWISQAIRCFEMELAGETDLLKTIGNKEGMGK